MSYSEILNQSALLLGFFDSILLYFSNKVGTIMYDGRVRFDNLDDLAPAAENKQRVLNSHWRHKWFTPIGWICLSLAFLLQLVSHHI